MTAPESPPVLVDLTVHPDLLLDQPQLLETACQAAGVSSADFRELHILRRSIDSRHRKPRIQLTAELHHGGTPPKRATTAPVALPSLTGPPSVIIVGAGPAGMFCALALAEAGVRAIVLDRGQPVAQRRRDVARLSQRGELNVESNYCFGEGGAGTFSDGKLYTRSKKRGHTGAVLNNLVAYGAPEDILVNARPHIGTNRLPGVITKMREHLESAGQTFQFGARVTGLLCQGQRVEGVRLSDGSDLTAPAVVLATGHSASNVYDFLRTSGVRLQAKPFAAGVRIEHSQNFIDQTQYGDLAGHPALGSAAYRLVERAGEQAVFSFCMCPGGFIVPASTHQAQQVVNGWSPQSRRGRYANSGLVVEVGPRDLAESGFDANDPFAGLHYQRALERRAYQAGGGDFVAPAQRLSEFLAGAASTTLPNTSYPRGLNPGALDSVLGPLAMPLRAALGKIEAKMPGFAGSEAIAVGVETRTSATLRIERSSKSLESASHEGLYPAAEGAGYAGGIMSAALDGIRIAQAIAAQPRFK